MAEIKKCGNIIFQNDEWIPEKGCFIVFDNSVGSCNYKMLTFNNYEDAEKAFNLWVEIRTFYD